MGVRNERWKYVETQAGEESDAVFAELYDLKSDAIEKTNLADDPDHGKTVRELAQQLRNTNAKSDGVVAEQR